MFTKVEDYVNARNDRAAYGRELPPHMRTILNSYNILRREFYRDLAPIELLNGALVSVNLSCDNTKQNKI